MNLGRTIRAQLEFLGMSVLDLCRESGLASGTVHRVLRGEDCYVSTLETIADTLGIQLSDLIAWSEEDEEE